MTSAGYFQRAVVGETGMIGTQVGKRKRPEMIAVYWPPCAIPPRNNNSNSMSSSSYIIETKEIAVNARGLIRMQSILFSPNVFVLIKSWPNPVTQNS
jgi:hypothetical protein